MKPQELLSSIGRRIAQVWNAITPSVAKTWRALFGEMNWQPPVWLRWLQHGLVHLYQLIARYLRERPKQAAIISGSILLGAIVIVAGWLWYQAQPKPVEVGFTITNPPITCYSCEPQGKPNVLRVNFNDSVAPVELTGHTLDMKKSSIKMDPAIAGEWRW
ncbi:MAG: hypothetical protein ABUL58_07750, partial [Steroidobacter sp.]